MVRCLDALTVAAQKNPRCALVRRKAELREAVGTDKLAVVLHLTGAPINGSLQVLRAYSRLGVRAIHPFIRNSPLGGDSSSAETTLTPLGRQAIREMDRCAILVDLAHANDSTFREVMRIARKPVLDSHTACRALRDLPRNRTDQQLRAIASAGGVVGVHFASQLLADLTEHPAYQAWRKIIADVPHTEARMRKRFPEPYAYLAHRYDALNWAKATGGAVEDGIMVPRASLSRLVDHVEHMVEVAGVDHVGVGSDYALSNICAGVETADKLPDLAAALRNRGYQGADLAKIMGGNVLRLFEEILPA
jgi:membrane dipeptidase